MLYDNVCAVCIPQAISKEKIKKQDLKVGRPALYVGESSRSIAERGREHWASYRGNKEDSHMLKHQVMEHGAAPAKFILRVVGSYQTALPRQVSEAVRIRRRGGEGSILNSHAEHNRCHIPRLRVEEEEESKKREKDTHSLGACGNKSSKSSTKL